MNGKTFIIIIVVFGVCSAEYQKTGKLMDDDKDDRKLKVKANSTDEEHKRSCEAAQKCEECVGIKLKYDCLWCGDDKKCVFYPFKSVVPKSQVCPWNDARWGVCWLDFKAMLISVSVIGAILLLTVCCCVVKICKCVTDCLHILKVCCCWCCCCCSSKDSSHSRNEERSLRRLEEIARRQERRDQLLLKFSMKGKVPAPYGSNYQKFENENI